MSERSASGSIKKVVSKKGTISYRVRFDAEPDPVTGKRAQRSRSYRTQAEARAASAEFRSAVRKGEFTDRSTLTVDQVLTEWLEFTAKAKSWRAATRYGNESSLRAVRALIGGMGVQRLTEMDILNLRERLVAGEGHREPKYRPRGKGTGERSPQTVNMAMQLLKSALTWAQKKGYVRANPMMMIQPLRETKTTHALWNAEQLARFFEVAATDRLAGAFALSASGLRRGEVAAARWSAVNWSEGLFNVVSNRVQVGDQVIEGLPKTQLSVRTVPLMLPVLETLRQARKEGLESEFIAVNELGEPIKPSHYSERFLALAESAGLPRITLHSMRRSITTLAREQGVDAFLIASIMGHSETVSRDSYTSRRDDPKVRAMGVVSEAIFGG